MYQSPLPRRWKSATTFDPPMRGSKHRPACCIVQSRQWVDHPDGRRIEVRYHGAWSTDPAKAFRECTAPGEVVMFGPRGNAIAKKGALA